jgi:putative ATP-dependent endonuclease of OLD family
MKISKISIKNFRWIQYCESVLPWNLTVFVGKNDSGKSSIIYALKSFFDSKITPHDVCKFSWEWEKVEIELSFDIHNEVNDLLLDEKKHLTIRKIFSFNEKWKLEAKIFIRIFDYSDSRYQNLWNKKEIDLNKIIADLWWEVKKSWAW